MDTHINLMHECTTNVFESWGPLREMGMLQRVKSVYDLDLIQQSIEIASRCDSSLQEELIWQLVVPLTRQELSIVRSDS